MSGLTRKQAEILGFLRRHIEDMGFAPTLEEIGERFAISAVTAREHVKALEAKGALRTERNRARSIELTGPDGGLRRIPIHGRIAAGLPIEAVDTGDGFELDELFPEGRDVFLLEVKGNSMIEDHIQDGDLVVVESRAQARNGETVVALLRGEEATLKHFHREGDKIRLEPANASMRSIIVPAAEVVIQGIVIGVIRRL